jgi:hypothetical protein
LSRLKYVFSASLVGFAVTVVLAVPTIALLFWLPISRQIMGRAVDWYCAGRSTPSSMQCGYAVALSWAGTIILGSIFVGMLVGTFAATIASSKSKMDH